MAELVAIGKISGAVGLKGELKVVSWSDVPGRFEQLRSVWIGPGVQDGRKCLVERVRSGGHNIVLKLSGIDDRPAAEEVRGYYLLVPGDDVAKPREGSFLVDDVLGMEVVTEEGKRVGTVREILRLPLNDLWQVDTGSKLIAIPAVAEFIRSVDVLLKRVVIHEIEGLLEL